MSKEQGKPQPIEFMHGRMMDLYHMLRWSKVNDKISVEVDGSEMNEIIRTAKTEVYEQYPGIDKFNGFAAGNAGSAPTPPPSVLKDGEPCSHPGCLSHISHPCEGCGRIGGHHQTPPPSGTGEGISKEQIRMQWVAEQERVKKLSAELTTAQAELTRLRAVWEAVLVQPSDWFDRYECSNCKAVLIKNADDMLPEDRQNHCPFCGVKLKWQALKGGEGGR